MKFIIGLLILISICINLIEGSTFSVIAFPNKNCIGNPSIIETKNKCTKGGECYEFSNDNKTILNIQFPSTTTTKFNVNECIVFEIFNSSIILKIDVNEDSIHPLEGYCNEVYYNDDNCTPIRIQSFNDTTCDNNRKRICKTGVITYLECDSCSTPDENCKIIPNDQVVPPKPSKCIEQLESKKYRYKNIFDLDNNNSSTSLITNMLLIIISTLILII